MRKTNRIMTLMEKVALANFIRFYKEQIENGKMGLNLIVSAFNVAQKLEGNPINVAHVKRHLVGLEIEYPKPVRPSIQTAKQLYGCTGKPIQGSVFAVWGAKRSTCTTYAALVTTPENESVRLWWNCYQPPQLGWKPYVGPTHSFAINQHPCKSMAEFKAACWHAQLQQLQPDEFPPQINPKSYVG